MKQKTRPQTSSFLVSPSMPWELEELQRKIRVLRITNAVAIPFLAVYAIITYTEGHLYRAVIDIFCCAVFVVNALVFSRMRRPQTALYTLITVMGGFFLFLYTEDTSAAMWSFVFPWLCFFLLGNRAAFAVIGVFGVACAAFMIYPLAPHMDYPLAFNVRYAGVFAITTISAFYFNKMRQQAYDSLGQRTRDLRESEERYRTMFESVVDGIAIMDMEGRLVEVNPAFSVIYGYEHDELIGMHASALISEEHRNTLKNFVATVRENGGFSAETVDLRKDGSRINVKVRGTSIHAGGNDYLLAVIEDVTGEKEAQKERDRLQEQLRQSEKMQAIGQLAGGVAHDFNNQLAGIMGYADMLHEKTRDNPLLFRYAERILTGVQRAADLTAQLLAYARKGNYRTVKLDMHGVIDEVVTLLKHSIDKRIDIVLELKAPRPFVNGDPTQLQNALLNLALNARDAMPGGGTLRFRTENRIVGKSGRGPNGAGLEPGPYLQIEVIDNGVGMDSQTQRHVFEPFFTTKEQGKGTGMGLAAVYGTLKSHNGCVSVTSAPGRGARFSLLVPLAERSGHAALADDPAPGRAAAASILLVEDEPALAEMAAEMLADLGHKVVTRADGRQAVEYYQSHWKDVDLVVLDMVMPEKGGADTFKEMRLVNSDARILLSSGYSVDQEASKLLLQGAAGFVQKPYSMAGFARAVADALAA
ncbi:MAG: PAS domain S-box protein [Chitinivibrionales bacterium]|nr:PAS domain S-box protein [Chitinivibrionales bacterium]MBD3396748.1 PAS domain S-box protein [Chitinivibrionales bacterium]